MSERKNENYKVYFKIPYEQKDKAKELKYQWDGVIKCWYKILYLNKKFTFKMDFEVCEKNNVPEVFEIFNKIKISQDETNSKDLLYSV